MSTTFSGPVISTAGFTGDLTGNVTGNVTGNITGNVTGNLAATGDSTVAKTITSATPSTERLFQSSITVTPATTFAVGSGGSLAGIRGDVTISTGKSFTDGFLYGAQGKVVLNGTMAEASAARIAGAIGQTDLASGTVTAGQVSGVWADLQGSPTLTVNDQVFPLRVTNSMSVNCQAMAFFYGKADFLFDIGEPSASYVVASAVGGNQSKKLKVNIGGATFYIPLNDA